MAALPEMLPLRAHDPVALLVEDLPALTATVVGTDAGAATLLLGDGALPARMLHRRRAAVERAHDGRRFRGVGTLAMAVGRRGHVREDTVIFHFGEALAGAAAPAGLPQRRALPRTPAVLPVTLVPLTAPIAPARALTLDVSTGGALVRSGATLDRGAEAHLHLQLPGEELPVPAAGAIVRRTAEGLLGVRLDRMRPADRALVERWLRGHGRR
jgi:PilZ domain